MEIIKTILIVAIKMYKALMTPLLRSVFGNGCIFTPTCSEYAVDAIEKYGIIHGVNYSIRRFMRCHPGTMPAYDPVPEEN
jgi:putative membrane protein insertion efficiency factor